MSLVMILVLVFVWLSGAAVGIAAALALREYFQILRRSSVKLKKGLAVDWGKAGEFFQ